MPLIILEGPDYAGKSTLAQELLRTWQDRSSYQNMTGDILHVGPPSKKPDDLSLKRWATVQTSELIRLMEKHDPTNPNHLIIFDRFHWGSAIYGPVYRPQNNQDNYGDLGYENFMWVEQQLATHGALTVHVTTSLNEMLERAQKRGEDEYLAQSDVSQELQLRKLWTRYMKFASNVGLFMPTFRGAAYRSGAWFPSDTSEALKEMKAYYDTDWPLQKLEDYYLYKLSRETSSVNLLLDEAIIKLKSRPYSRIEFRNMNMETK